MKNGTFSRRVFLRRTAAGAGAVALAGISARSYGQVVGANSDIRIGVAGCNDCGRSHIRQWTSLAGVRLVALCDVDTAVLQRGVEQVAASTRPTAITKYADVRKMLESKELDAVSAAPPNHWHALMTIWACQAGKDMYIEKPVSHSPWEGGQMLAAARKYERIVQAGTQWRSMPQVFEAMEYAKSGKLGKVLISRGLCYKPRPSIGKAASLVVPGTVDFDMWCGPAPKELPARTQFHYDWHWFWETGNGDIGNQGAHQMDLARWALGDPGVAPSVITMGGRFGYVDDGQTPNSVITVHDYGTELLIFEVRGLPVRTGAGTTMDTYKGADIGNVIECKNGYVSISQRQCAAFDKEGKQLQVFTGNGVARDRNHQENFLKAVRSRKRADQQGEIEVGVVSANLVHVSNMSYRVGRQAGLEEVKAALAAPAAAETLERLRVHLAANGVKLETEKAQLGMPLKVESGAGGVVKIVGNEMAAGMMRRKYRAGFEVPEGV